MHDKQGQTQIPDLYAQSLATDFQLDPDQLMLEYLCGTAQTLVAVTCGRCNEAKPCLTAIVHELVSSHTLESNHDHMCLMTATV